MLSPLARLPEGVDIMSTKILLPILHSVMLVQTTPRVVSLSVLTISSAFTITKRFLRLFIRPIPVLTCTQQARAKQVEQEYLRQVHAITKEGRKAADVLADGVIVGLGIIQQAQEDKKKS